MRRIELALLFLGIDGKRLQEILIHTPYQVTFVEIGIGNLVHLVNHRLDDFRLYVGRSKNLLWQCPTQSGMLLLHTVENGIQLRIECSIRLQSKHRLPPALGREVEHILIEIGVFYLGGDISLVFHEIETVLLKVVQDTLPLQVELLAHKAQEY